MPLYAVTKDHKLAIEKVRLLQPDVFEAQLAKAESLLGLGAPVLTDATSVERLHIALIEQINFQVHQGISPLVEESSSSSHSRSSVKWRDRYISPIAAQIVADVVPVESLGWGAGGDGGSQSHRTNDGGGHRVRANGGWYVWPRWYSR